MVVCVRVNTRCNALRKKAREWEQWIAGKWISVKKNTQGGIKANWEHVVEWIVKKAAEEIGKVVVMVLRVDKIGIACVS